MPALNYTHYGALTTTTQKNGVDLDARAAVGHLSRNVKIINSGSLDWGYRILVYGYS